ncbi:MAG: Mur ligase family protein [Minisyncoccia bacterium]
MKRKILQHLLWFLAKITLWCYRPLIIAVVGSTGKSSTKEAIYYALKNNFKVARSESNLNTEIGLPLTIIEGQNAKTNIGLWLKNIFHTLSLVLIKQKDYPQIWVLEMSEDHPHLISYLVRLSHPKIGVISWIGETPVHQSFYSRPEVLQEEMQNLVKYLPKDGTAVLNYDNNLALAAKDKTQAQVITYGFQTGSQVEISNYNLIVDKNLRNLGMSLRLEYQGSYVPLKLQGVFGQAQAYALAAGAAVGLALGLNLIQIAESLKDYKMLKARTNFLPGLKDTWILEDSYNSNPDALKMALTIYHEVVEGLKQTDIYPLKRRVLAIGDMRELGKESDEAHRKIAPFIVENADLLIAVGDKMKLVTEECQKLGFSPKNIYWFKNSVEAGKKAKELIEKGDLFLVKGSRGIHMEQVSLAIMKEPEKAKDYLSFEEPT